MELLKTLPPVGGGQGGRSWLEPFDDPGQRLLGADTPTEELLRKIPVVRQAYGFVDPAAIHQSEPVAGLGIRKEIFRESQKSRAKAAAMEWMAEARETLGFGEFRNRGRAMKAQLAPGAPQGPLSRQIYDLVEHPERYVFTQPQKATILRGQGMMNTLLRAEQSAGVDVDEVANYWARSIVGTSKPEPLIKRLIEGQTIRASTKGHTRGRFYEFAEDTARAGYKLEPDPLVGLTRRLEAGIDAIADKETVKRIAQLPGVETPTQRMDPALIQNAATARRTTQTARLLKAATNRVGRGERLPAATLATIKRAFPAEGAELERLRGLAPSAPLAEVRALSQQADSLITQSSQSAGTAVSQRARAMERARLPRMGEAEVLGKIAPKEMVDQIDKWIDLPGRFRQHSPGPVGTVVEEVLQLWRSTLVSLDLSASYIQGQQLFFRNHPAWWRAQVAAVGSLIKEPLNYVAKNYSTIDEGIQMGAITPPSEFLVSTRGISGLPRRLPVTGGRIGLVTRTNRAFEWFTFVGQHELYKAARGNGKATEELVSLSSAIRKIMGTESNAIMGLTRRQKTVEAYLAFAPRFYRALHGTITQAFTPGLGGNEARKALGAMIAGATGLTMAVNYATTGRMPNYTEVESETWGKAKVNDSYVSFYGPMHSLFRTLARASVYSARNQKERATNAVGYYFKSKASLPVRGAETLAEIAVTGESRTFDGKIVNFTPEGAWNFAQDQALPIGVGQVTQDVAEDRPEGAMNIVGLNAQPALRENAKTWESKGKLPPDGTSLNQLQVAYQQAGESKIVSQAAKDAWHKYEMWQGNDAYWDDIIKNKVSGTVAAEFKAAQEYRNGGGKKYSPPGRRKQLAAANPELDVWLVEEAHRNPGRSYTPVTTEGKARQKKLIGGL
jgi:hypothetical protein